jgi:hypothetical protein
MPKLPPMAWTPATIVFPMAPKVAPNPEPAPAAVNPAAPTVAIPAVNTTAAATAILRQCFLRNLPVFLTAFFSALMA